MVLLRPLPSIPPRTPNPPRGMKKDLHLAFDVGHSSIGWAVLQKKDGALPELLGCGSVIFQADDCLASQRRGFRRQRRHIRATRLRIARMKRLLAHLGVLTQAQLDTPGCAWPWLLAARVLRGGKRLTWPELWDVLRWYAHNRGYDGNKGWSRQSGDELDDAKLAELANDPTLTDDERKDIDKVKTARKLMREKGTATMAETFCAVCGLDPLGETKSCNLSGSERFKAQKAAFPRKTIESEVLRILQLHKGALAELDDLFIRALLSDWRAYDKTLPGLYFSKSEAALLRSELVPFRVAKGEEAAERRRKRLASLEIHHRAKQGKLTLPVRFHGGLLFGQLYPRFDNRIIGTCPFSGEKVPSRRSREFLDFRWTMLMAGIRIALVTEEELRPLTPEERLALDRRGRELGFFRYEREKFDKRTGTTKPGKNELRTELHMLTGCDRDNLDGLLFDDNMREALKVVPVSGDSEAFRIAWGAFDGPTRDEKTGIYLPDKLRGRFITMLLRGTLEKPASLTITKILNHLEVWDATTVADRLRERLHAAAVKKGKPDAKKLAELESVSFELERLSGRARYGREVMDRAVQDWMRGTKPQDPRETGGTLERTEAILETERERELDELTNNHLVRHRLRLLAGEPSAAPKPFRGLIDDLIGTYAGGEWGRIARLTVELARDIQEMSGKDRDGQKTIENAKLESHERASEALAMTMRAEGIPFAEADGRPRLNATLIRKARIALDMEASDENRKCRGQLAFRCPYTGDLHCLADVVRGKMEKDHIVPRSKRLSDALEAMVLTKPEINREKDARTALEFIREMNLPENAQKKAALKIRTEAQYLEFVQNLWPKSDPFRRVRAGGERPSDDEIRCWRRKVLLLVPKWDKPEFTPADLTKTRHLAKLAALRLEARFPQNARPPVITVNGGVTAAFRDRAWKMFRELGAANREAATEINRGSSRIALIFAGEFENEREAAEKEFERQCKKLKTGDDLKKGIAEMMKLLPAPGEQANFDAQLATTLEENQATAMRSLFQWQPCSANLKKNIRGITHLHHALDAVAMGLIVEKLVPVGHTSLDARLVHLLIKRKLDADERKEMEGILAKLRLPRFFQWRNGNEIMLPELEPDTKKQLRKRLAECRVVQHIPAEIAGLSAELNAWRVLDVKDGIATITQRNRKADGSRPRKPPTKVKASKLLGLYPSGKDGREGKLSKLQAALVIPRNYGIALDPEPTIIPFHKVWVRLRELREKNGGRSVRVLRNGMLVRLKNTHPNRERDGVWRIYTVQATLKIDFVGPDVVGRPKKGSTVWREVSIASLGAENIEILRPGLCGVAAVPPGALA